MKVAKYPEPRGKIAIAVENKFNSYFSSECENYVLCFEDMEVNHKSLREENVTLVLYYDFFESCDCYNGKYEFHKFFEKLLKMTSISDGRLDVVSCKTKPCLSTPDYVQNDYSMKKIVRINSLWNE